MSEENSPKNYSFGMDVDNGTFQMACIDTSEDTREGIPKFAAEDRKHRKIPSDEEQHVHVGKDKKRDKRHGIESGPHHLSRSEEKKKHKYHEKSEEESTSEDEEERRKVYNNKSTAEEDSTSEDQEGKSKERRRERVRESGHDVPAKDYKRKDKHKSKVTSKERDKDHDSIVPHQLGEDIAFAENQGSVKHILILGTIGSGKYTIARNISTNPRNFPTPRKSLRERSGIIQCIDDGNRFKFVLVDTGGARMPDVYGAKGPSIGSIAANIKDYLKSGISLIMVVVRFDCNIPDDFEVLSNLINGLFTDEGKKHIALIHNGCEMLSEENVEEYTRNFNAGGPSRRLSSLCRKDTVATGFPSSEESRSEMAVVLKQITEESKRKLSCLIESCRYLQPYSKILKANNDPSRVFPETKADCCLM